MTTLWSTIADALRDEIAGGARAPGDRLPTEARLAARFDVNRHTVRRALAALAEEGLLRARRGAGVFVTDAPVDYPIGLRTRFRQSMRAAGRVPGRRILSAETRPCDAVEAEALHLAPGAPIHITEGLAFSDDRPVALFRSRYPVARLPGIAEALNRLHSVTEALRACGIADYVRLSTRLTAEPATAVQAVQLHLAPGAPLLRSEAVNADPEGRPVEYGVTRFAGDRVTLTLDHS